MILSKNLFDLATSKRHECYINCNRGAGVAKIQLKYKRLLTCSLTSVDKSFADLANGKDRRCFDIVPIFTCERINTETQNNDFFI